MYSYSSSRLLMPRGSIALALWIRWGFTCFPERITPIFKFFNRNQKHMVSVLLVSWALTRQPAKTSVSRRSSPLGTFREEERLRLGGRNSILMTQINVYIINPVVMGFQIQICPILRVLASGRFWLSFVFICQPAPAKLKRLFQSRVYSTNIDCFARDSSRLSFVNNS